MKGTKNYEKLVFFLIATVPFINQLSNTNNNFSSLLYVPYVMILFCYLYSKSKLNISNVHKIIFLLLVGVYTISPIVGLTIFKYNPLQNIIYVLLFLIFIFSIACIVSLVDRKKFGVLLKSILFGNSIILIINIILNIDDLNLQNFYWVLNGFRESRAYFGFAHPNTVGMYLFIEIILIYYYYKQTLRYKYFWISSSFVFLICLIATGSRTAVLSLILFFLVEFYLKIISKVNNKLQISLLFGVILPLLFLYLTTFNFEEFFGMTSGRNDAIIQNFNVLIENDGLIFGIAPINISNLSLISGLTYSDNWYITHFIQFGLIGMIIFVAILSIIIVIGIKNYKLSIIPLLIVIMFYSSAENVMFIPGVLLSWVIWVLILSKIKIN